MFYAPIKADAAWGANIPNSPVWPVNYWYLSEQESPQSSCLSPAATKQRGRLPSFGCCGWSCLRSAQAERE
jgi:hypothetical protein